MKIGVKFPLKSYRAVVGHVVEVFIKPPIIYHFFLKVPHFLKVHMCKYVAIFCWVTIYIHYMCCTRFSHIFDNVYTQGITSFFTGTYVLVGALMQKHINFRTHVT
jgi:hypothetical protein